MENNIFVLVNTRTRKPVLTTRSAKKCRGAFTDGHRIEIWRNNEKVMSIYNRNIDAFSPYIMAEKRFHADRQEELHRKKELRRQRAKERLYGKTEERDKPEAI